MSIFPRDPQAPTPLPGDADQSIATTKFVMDAVGAAGGGDMLKSTYDSDNDGKVDNAEVAEAVPWGGVTGKPSAFPPDIELVDDRVAALLVAGTNIVLSYNDAAGSLTIAASSSGIADAPMDGRSYGRRDGAWDWVVSHNNDIVDGGNF